MKRSIDRILSTHVGSLIRPPKLAEAIQARQNGQMEDAAYQQCLRESVAEVVKRQLEAGVDVINDGEFGKSTSWSLYILKRLSGFEMRPAKASAFARGADREHFKDFYEELEGARATNREQKRTSPAEKRVAEVTRNVFMAAWSSRITRLHSG